MGNYEPNSSNEVSAQPQAPVDPTPAQKLQELIKTPAPTTEVSPTLPASTPPSLLGKIVAGLRHMVGVK